MSTVETETRLLSREDIQAMKACDRVTFFHQGLRDGDGTIRMTKRIEKRGPFDPDERTIELSNLSSRVTDYGKDGEGQTYLGSYYAYAGLSAGSHSDGVWGTVCVFVKPGDELRLRWVADGNTHTRKAELFDDTLELIVVRVKEGKGQSRYPFILDNQTYPDNSARMIRHKQ